MNRNSRNDGILFFLERLAVLWYVICACSGVVLVDDFIWGEFSMRLRDFQKWAVVVPVVGAFFVLSASADAATYQYRLLDHPDGTASTGNPHASYGLRLDYANPDAYWSFENGGNAIMTIDDGGGVAGAGSMTISGTMRQSFGTVNTPQFGDLWDVSYTITGLTVGANGTFTDTGGSGGGSIASTVTTASFGLGAKANTSGEFFVFEADGHRVPGNSELIGRGWVDNGSNWPGANDFLFRVAEVPLPAAGWMLIVGIGSLAFARRRRMR